MFLRAAGKATEKVPRDFVTALEELDRHRQRLDEAEAEAGHANERLQNFSSLARIYSEHSSRERGGVLGALSESQFNLLDLPTTLMDAEPLSLHGPYQASLGAHLVLVVRHHPARGFEDLETSQLEQHARNTVTQRVREGVRIEQKL